MKIAAIGAFAMSLSIVSCGDFSLEKTATKIREATGLKVEVNTEEHDECAVDQIQKIGLQLRLMKKAQREELISGLKSKYSTLTIEKSVVTKRTTGSLKKLILFDFVCNDSNCWYEPKDSKLLVDNLKIEGEEPASKFVNDRESLKLVAEATHKNNEIVEYMTTNVGLYEQIEDIESPMFVDGMAAKVITKRRTVKENGLFCNVNNDILNQIP